MNYFDHVTEAAELLRGHGCAGAGTWRSSSGSGLGAFADGLADAARRALRRDSALAGLAVVGHAGKLVCGTVAGRHVLALSGRAHFYEGHACGRSPSRCASSAGWACRA